MQSYAYSIQLWPSFLVAVLIVSLAGYGWRHRKVPGALPFAIGCLFGLAWTLGSMLETAATDLLTKIFWLRFLTIWQIPVVSAATCFILQYAGLGRLLTRRALVLLAIPPLLFAALFLTDGLHHLGWTSMSLMGGSLRVIRGPATSAGLIYSYLLFIVNIGVLAWLFLRSPRHRRPVAVMLIGQIGARALFELSTRLGFPTEWDPDPFVLAVVFCLYAVVLFGFHALDPVPAARAAAIDQMREGMLVLDVEGRIVDANEAAESILGKVVSRLRGRPVAEVLPSAGDLPVEGNPATETASEVDFESSAGARHYEMERTPLADKHGYKLGSLLLLHDVTEQRKAQTRLVEQERVVATLQERERLARELHDSIGQVLGYVSMQTQTIRKWLQEGDGNKADALLGRLTEIAQSAHADVRESILALRAASSENWSLLATLGRYLEDFSAHYGIQTDLMLGEGVSEGAFDQGSGVQVLRVIQEALSNTRRHGSAKGVSVSIEQDGDHVRVVVADDGRGFDPVTLGQDPSLHFGLAFMRERMAQIGGRLEIDSQPGRGTRVSLEVPVSDAREGDT